MNIVGKGENAEKTFNYSQTVTFYLRIYGFFLNIFYHYKNKPSNEPCLIGYW